MEIDEKNRSGRLCILVVEDDQDLLESETRMLSRAGFEVRAAPDGEEALRILETTRLDIVLTDLRLPGINGIQVLRAIREKSPGTRVYLVTAYVDNQVRAQAFQLGAAGFLTKPVTRADLLRALGPSSLER